MGSGLSSSVASGILDWRLLQAFQDMKEVVQYGEYYMESPQLLPLDAEIDYINSKSYQFRYMALTTPFEVRQPVSDKQEPCRLSMLIFWFGLKQVTKSDSALSRTLSMQLKNALQKTDLQGAWAPHLELLLWILMMGAYITAGQRERPWFILHLSRVAQIWGLKEWDAVRRVLLRFYYIDRVYATGMREAWTEAMMLTG